MDSSFMKKLRIAVVGVGHLGYHHARILAARPDVQLVGVADSAAERCAAVAAELGVPAYEDYRRLIDRTDAASIVVPTVAHHEVACEFLAAGKSLLIEKPLTADVDQADRLVRLAERQGAVLQVGHIERFNPVLAALPARAEPPRFIEAHRLGPYSFRSTDIGVVFDLMIHDLDLVCAVVGGAPERVDATAWSVFGGHEDIATAHLTFPNGTVAQLTASRASRVARRSAAFWWADAHTELDFAAQRSVTCLTMPEFHAERGRFLRPSLTEINELRTLMPARYFRTTERDWSGGPDALSLELDHFVTCLRTGTEPLVSGARGRDAVRLAAAVLDAAQRPAARVVVPPPDALPHAA